MNTSSHFIIPNTGSAQIVTLSRFTSQPGSLTTPDIVSLAVVEAVLYYNVHVTHDRELEYVMPI